MKVIFDFDGTLHQTHLIYKKAMEVSLKEIGLEIKDIDYKSLIGFSPLEVWQSLGLNYEQSKKMIRKTGRIMDQNVKEFGKLYDNSYEVLSYLKDKYQLLILSNCRNSYMNAARYSFKLDKYFDSYLTGENFSYMEKYKILRKLKMNDYIVIGDRKNDIEAGYKNKCKSIFASFGYGKIKEGENADYIIGDILQIKNIL